MNYLRNVQSWIFTCTMTRYDRAVQQTAVRMCYCHSTFLLFFFSLLLPFNFIRTCIGRLIQMTPSVLRGLSKSRVPRIYSDNFSLYIKLELYRYG